MSKTPRWLREAAWERADAVCEAMIPQAVCQWHGTDVHHRKKRSAGGEHALENALWVCRNCHNYIEAHQAWSFPRGLLVHSYHEPVHPPAYYRGVYTPREEGT
ncbi:HNH endonuclease signature motif containing protein [Corynebacterium sp. CNJ-954]|uniref:HNH endonuclease n=1 Tax=Corynebacterium sp. CNJ-954 TaxID=1904962 RepID=UPI00096AACBB